MNLLRKVDGEWKVSIFTDLDRVEIDKNLPKYQQDAASYNPEEGYGTPLDFNLVSNSIIMNSDIDSTIRIGGNISVGGQNFIDQKIKESWFSKILNKFKKSKEEAKIESEEESKMTVLEFFENIKAVMTVEEQKDYVNSIKNYMKEMTKARDMGQKAIFEKMRSEVGVMKLEAILQAKKVKVLTSEQIVTLGRNAKRGIKLDYIKNFARIVPDEVYKKKLEADSWKIYDNYVVMHYDPDDKGSLKTVAEREEEIKKKRDPILFGVISGSTSLYYIGDWVDEYCDLTLDKAIEIINSAKDDKKKI